MCLSLIYQPPYSIWASIWRIRGLQENLDSFPVSWGNQFRRFTHFSALTELRWVWIGPGAGPAGQTARTAAVRLLPTQPHACAWPATENANEYFGNVCSYFWLNYSVLLYGLFWPILLSFGTSLAIILNLYTQWSIKYSWVIILIIFLIILWR